MSHQHGHEQPDVKPSLHFPQPSLFMTQRTAHTLNEKTRKQSPSFRAMVSMRESLSIRA